MSSHPHLGRVAGAARYTAVLLPLLLVLATAATAAGPDAPAGSISIVPDVERITSRMPDGTGEIQPGAVIRRSIRLRNDTDGPATFLFDVARVVGSSGDLVLEVRHGDRSGVAGWTTLDRGEVRLRPGTGASVPLTIRVPTPVSPGTKTFAVTATRSLDQAGGSGGAGVSTNLRLVSLFVLEIPGDAPVRGSIVDARLTVRSSDRSRGIVRFTYRNDGERLLAPTGRVVVRDGSGDRVTSAAVPRFAAYPDGEAAVEVPLRGLPTFGAWTARIELTSPELGAQRLDLPRVVAIPWWATALVVAGIVAALCLLALGARAWRRRRRPDDVGQTDDADEIDDADEDSPGADQDEDVDSASVDDD